MLAMSSGEQILDGLSLAPQSVNGNSATSAMISFFISTLYFVGRCIVRQRLKRSA